MSFWRYFIPSKNEREIRRLQRKLEHINALEPQFSALSDDKLRDYTSDLQARFQKSCAAVQKPLSSTASYSKARQQRQQRRQDIDQSLEPLLPEAFALVREASKRVLGLRHYDSQLLGGMALHEGKIAEMKTGEGKTLVATLPVYLNALTGLGVHVVTVNEYLAARDAQWMGQLYRFLGLEVGVIVHGKSDAERAWAYDQPITYGTNSEFGFDYLRDNMKFFLNDYVQRELYFAIVDEVDSILIDEARTPLIISGPSEESTDKYVRIDGIIPSLKREVDFTIDEKARTVHLTEQGIHHVEERLKVGNLYDPQHMEILHHVHQSLRAHTLYRRDVEYIVESGRIKIIDEFTGRVLEGRRWSEGLHQAIEAKEGVPIEYENQTLATITYQNYFRNFIKLGGMTGTAETEAEEFAKIYDLDVVAIPTHRPMVRQDLHDLVYKSEREKFAAIVDEVIEKQKTGQPILLGTVSVEKSEILSRLLQKHHIPHNVLNAKHHHREAEIIAQAGRKGTVTIATNMAGRGTDILLGGNPEFLTRHRLMEKFKISPEEVEAHPDYATCFKAMQEQCLHEKEEVVRLGGLYILGTERHESRRIDNQLRGRAGRQGDPGCSRFYISLEDDLMRIFGGDRMIQLMERMGMKEGEVIEHPMLNRTIENAQRRVEGHNFDVRKHLLEYDDVMNDQRIAIYDLRRNVIGADVSQTREQILDLIEESILYHVAQHCSDRIQGSGWDTASLLKEMGDCFAYKFSLPEGIIEHHEMLEEHFYREIFKELQVKEERYTTTAFYHIARIIYLQTIDFLWKDHLRAMDYLREGVNLHGYAQKDPKLEYKKEGFALFTSMMGTIARETIARVFRVVITASSESEYQRSLQQEKRRLADQWQQGMMDDGVQEGSLPAAQKATRKTSGRKKAVVDVDEGPAVLESAKVQRNAECPCGSGKKYKKCCFLKPKEADSKVKGHDDIG